MGRSMSLPDEGSQWITEEIMELLRAITGAHAAKKRSTVIKVAVARATQQPLKAVFRQHSTCSEAIWYGKWRHQPALRAAYEACYQRALGFEDEATAGLEGYYAGKRRRAIAEYAADAPAALAAVMAGVEQKGADRISAAEALLRWAEPETAKELMPAQVANSSEQVINQLFADMSSDELVRILKDEEDLQEEGDPAGPEGAGA